MLLGSLTIGLKAIDILPPRQPPYNGFSFKGLIERLNEIRVPLYCNGDHRIYDDYDCSTKRTCDRVERPLHAKIEEPEQNLLGLELTGGVPSS